jgi:exodeoxyribonuclease-5
MSPCPDTSLSAENFLGRAAIGHDRVQNAQIQLEMPKGKPRLDEFDWGYVITCHKAQGSSWEHVTIVDDSGSFRENRQKWLYTALTRAETGLTLLTRQ